MATETVTEMETVEKERKIKVCDYCQLITSEDIGEDEEFGRMLLEPEIEVNLEVGMKRPYLQELARADDKVKVRSVLIDLMRIDFDDHADLCPNCVDSLFGEGPATGIRSGSGYL